MLDIFVEGLEVYGHHGVASEEKVLGGRLRFDIRLTVEHCAAEFTDKVEDAVDYTEVIDLVSELATVSSYSLLERLARVTAESILRHFPVDEVWVQVTKPAPPVACALKGVGVAIELTRADVED
jgi:7,8-dihydroneopterin aldolase/epimerase/oxygenase